MIKQNYIPVLVYYFLIFSISSVYAQKISENKALYFISDCQEPMKAEELFLKPYRNIEARDSLFSDIIRQNLQNLFLLGDLTAAGSKSKKWKPIERFLFPLHEQKVNIYAISGNHEYYRSSKKGIQKYRQHFPNCHLYGYCIRVDSMAIIMLNSNFNHIPLSEQAKQKTWYYAMMDSLDIAPEIKFIMVGTHHPPYTNSKVVEPSKYVADNFVSRFLASPKSRLFLSGHSHNLEYFKYNNKYFLVAGGGGGLSQPLLLPEFSKSTDLIAQNKKPLYFYVIVERAGNSLYLRARGLKRNFSTIELFDIGRID
jgi:predicted MPP superfamily phosphohydrolase